MNLLITFDEKIKSLRPKDISKGGKYYQGLYKKSKLKKYASNSDVIYRSSLEFLFIQYLEKNNNIIKWYSEPGYITYKFENKEHKYYIDFVYIDKNDNVFYIEIKPYSEVLKAKYEKLNKNANKWKAIISLCKEYNGHHFKIITERFFV